MTIAFFSFSQYMSQIEILDIFNNSNTCVDTAPRDQAHTDGLWHRTVNFLVVDSQAGLVFFQNKKNKRIDEDFFVQINGGHITAGETIEEGFRELQEELGVEKDQIESRLAGVIPTSVDLGAEFKLREFMYYYYTDINSATEQIYTRLNSKNVESTAFISCDINDGYKLLVTKSIEHIEGNNITKDEIQDVSLSKINFKNFTDDNLYSRIFSYLKRQIDEQYVEMPL